MKKETKKKVLVFSLLSSLIFAFLITPTSIVLNNLINKKDHLEKKETRQIDQHFVSSQTIESDYTLNLDKAVGLNGKTISIGTTNIAKSIPQGYLVISGNSSNNKNQQIICLDKKDPTKLL